MAADTTSSEIQVHRRLGQIDFRLEFFTMRDQQTIESRIKEYLKMLGYQVIEKLNKTYFKRGTIWSTFYSTSPRGVPTMLDVSYEPDIDGQMLVTAKMIIRTTGGIATKKDIDFWMAEIAGIEQSALGENVDMHLSQYAADRAKWHSCALVMAIIVFIFLAMSTFIFLMLITPSPAHCGC